MRQLFEAPALVVAFDERSDGRAGLGEVSKPARRQKSASVIITADQKLVNRATERVPGLEIRHIGASGLSGQTRAFDP